MKKSMRSNPSAFPSITDIGLLSHDRSYKEDKCITVAINIFAILEKKANVESGFMRNFSPPEPKIYHLQLDYSS